MYDALKELGHSKHQVFRANCALRVFWSWLQLKRIVSRDTMLFTRNPDMGQADEDTPMERVITPEEALALAKKHSKERPDLSRYILLSMFFSLRPQECFGVRAGDFRAGQLATEFGCSKIMVGFGQYGRYVVYVGRQRTKTMSYRPPKKGSRGWVACFNKEAAKLLHSLIGDDTAPESHVMQCTPNEFYTAWRDDWYMGFAPKDLRRSSLTHLGLIVGFGMLQLMAHARQRTAKSLLRYLRSPDNKAKKAPLPKASDFDDDEDADGKTDDMDSAS